ALSAASLYPERVRTLVLDSTAFSDASTAWEEAIGTDQAMQMLFDQCQAEPACERRYPQLHERFRQLHERLQRQPLMLKATHPFKGTPIQVRIDGDMLAYIVLSAMYSHGYPAEFPRLVASLEAGRTEELLRQMDTFLGYSLYERFSDLVLFA